MKKVTDWIKRHQITAFFILTFAISWGLGFTLDPVMNKGSFLLAPLAFIAICGPALAGIIISSLCNDQPIQSAKKAYRIAFLVAWIVSTIVFLGNNLFTNHAPFSPVMVIFIFVTVVPVAFVISMAYSRNPTVKHYLSSLVRLRGVWGWSLLALFLVPVLVLLSIPISSVLGRTPIGAHHFTDTGLALTGLIAVKFLYQLFFFNATGEESGWRGFALPRLQSLTSPLVACLVLNLIWPLWHLFYWMAEGRPVFSIGYWAQTYWELLPATVIIGWLYNRSKGSILVAGITHAAANTAFMFFPNLDWQVYTWTVAFAALVMILVDRMWKKLPSDHPAVYQVPGIEDYGKGEIS
jgi:uncharacterized protein